LAYLYKDKQGKNEEAVLVFNRLMELESDEIKLMQYRIAILDIAITLGKLRNLIRTVLKTSEYMDSIKAQYKDDKEFKKLMSQLEGIIKELATTYHKQAKTTFNDVYFKISWKFYKEYQRLFVGYEDYYPMLFQYAQLLDEDLHRKEDAIDVYIQIITDDGGKQAKNLVEDAVNNALSIYAELIKEERAKKGGQGDCHKRKPPKPEKLTRRQEQFIKLVNIFIEHNPQSKEIPSARYSAARVYYQTCHFEKAVPVFEDIVDNYQDSSVYEPAASILLDMLNTKKEYTQMHKRVTQFMKYKDKFSPKFKKQLQENFEAIAFMSPKELEEKKKYVESAKAYYEYYKKYPKSNNAFYSLYNASQMYENAGLMKETIAIREEIISDKKFDNKKERPDVLFFLAQNYQSLVRFNESANLYASFFERYPKDKRAKSAIEAAISFYEIYGSLDSLEKANKLIDLYVSHYRLNIKKKSIWFFRKGVNIENSNNLKLALKYWAEFERDYNKVLSNEKVIEIQFKIGDIYKKLGNDKSAIKKYKDGYEYYQKLSSAKKKKIKDANKMLASYKFYELEKTYKQFKSIRIKLPKAVMLTTLKQKIKLKDFLLKSYVEAYKEFQNPDWSIAYFYKMASLLYDFAKDIQNAPIPKFKKTRDITVQEQIDMYKDDLYQAYVYPLEQEAFKAALRCYNTAMKNQIFNEWVDKSMDMMIKIDSSAFKVNLDEQHEDIDFYDIVFTNEEPVLEIKNKNNEVVGNK
jgi:tetratricopeptide (TPR) repeat protein